MAELDQQRSEAEQLTAEATRLHSQGSDDAALVALRRAVLLYAEVERRASERNLPSPLQRQARADTCQLYGDLLAATGAHAEAANTYQEAADLYGAYGDAAQQTQMRRCARKAMDSIVALRARPQERLYLLIGHYERQQQQLALQPDTEEQQGNCCVHIAGIFLRRDRPVEALDRYKEALRLYACAPQTPEVLLATAECHHRIAGLMVNSFDNLVVAAEHYGAAIALYAQHETPYYGVQSGKSVCLRALADVQRSLMERSRESNID